MYQANIFFLGPNGISLKEIFLEKKEIMMKYDDFFFGEIYHTFFDGEKSIVEQLLHYRKIKINQINIILHTHTNKRIVFHKIKK